MNGFELLAEARNHWLAMADFRQRRDRCKDYTYGRQWNEIITVEGRKIREEDYIREQGHIPLKNNLIRRIVRNVLGVFRNEYSLPDYMDLGLEETPESVLLMNALKISASENNLIEIFSRTLEEFLISGLAVLRKNLKKNVKKDSPIAIQTEIVSPDSFFIDADVRDPRGTDLSAIGQIHELKCNKIFEIFVKNADEIGRIKNILEDCGREALNGYCRLFGVSEKMVTDFLSPSVNGNFRIVEYWRLEQRVRYRCHDTADGTIFKIEEKDFAQLVETENKRRCQSVKDGGKENLHLIEADWMMEEIWHYYFIAPNGAILMEGDSPYPHGGHPYVFKAYPFVDGEIHSFVADCIDQQRYINRLITLYDWIMRASAKGVLLFPEGALPDDVDIDEISDEWSRFNGVILFKPKPGMPLPQQVSCNAANIGITELLQVQLKMMEDVSGVNSALQGNIASGAVSGTLYSLQTRHAMTGLLDLLESFKSFMNDAAKLEIKLLSQKLHS